MSRVNFGVSARAWSIAALPALLFVADGSATGGITRSRTVHPTAYGTSHWERGLRYSFMNRSTTTTPDGAMRVRVMAAGTGSVLGSNARVDLTDAASNFVVKKGSYMLVKGESGTITIVEPPARTYYELSAAELGQSIAAITGAASSLVRMQVSGLETRGESLGAGPAISGVQTTHYRITQRYTLSVSVFGKKSTMTSSSTIDYFVAPSLAKDLVYPFMDLGTSAGQMVPSGTGLGEITQQVMDEQRKLFTGPAIKMLTRTESVDEKGRTSVSMATNEITGIERAEVDPAIFDIPAGFKATASPMAPMAPVAAAASPRANSSSNQPATAPRNSAAFPAQVGDAAKQGASDGATSGVREGARDAVAKKVRGIFRKP